MIRLALLAAALAALPSQAPAQQMQAVYELSLRGIAAARLSVSGRQEGGRYAVTGRVRDTGLVSLLADIQYDVAAEGRVSGEGYRPARYRETDDDDTVEITWGREVRTTRTPPRDRPEDVDPAQQAGRVDPLTAMWGTVRPQPRDGACDASYPIYDGSRTSTLSLGAPRAEGEGLVCAGTLTRTGGYSADELEDGRSFDFTVSYVPVGQGMVQASEVRMRTTYGPAALRLISGG